MINTIESIIFSALAVREILYLADRLPREAVEAVESQIEDAEDAPRLYDKLNRKIIDIKLKLFQAIQEGAGCG